jgi:hypothetical protein
MVLDNNRYTYDLSSNNINKIIYIIIMGEHGPEWGMMYINDRFSDVNMYFNPENNCKDATKNKDCKIKSKNCSSSTISNHSHPKQKSDNSTQRIKPTEKTKGDLISTVMEN